jgi:glycosyltransferase involved in cell wall biosynthesis
MLVATSCKDEAAVNARNCSESQFQAEARAGKGASTTYAPVSVVVPCFRAAATLDEAVASIASQTLPPAEVLLVDDASGDGTLDAMRRIAASYREGWIEVIALPANGGPSRARNVGWSRARQPYVAFLDADDCWGPHKLELQMAAIQADPGIALIAHQMRVQRRGTPVPAAQHPAPARLVGRGTVLVRNPFPTPSVVLRRDLPFRFDENFRRSEDYLLWSQIALSGYRCARIDQVLGICNRREGGAVGLSDDVAAVHRARRDLRRKLLHQGLMSRKEYALAAAFGLVNWIRLDLRRRLRRRRLRPPDA